MIRLIAAVDSELGLADDHGIPWQGKIPLDAKYFNDETTEGIIVMGFRTYQEFDKPLHGRENYVVTRPDSGELRPEFTGVDDLSAFLEGHALDLVWVIGGAGLFAQSLDQADELYITQLDRGFHCTKFFPYFRDAFELVSQLGPHVESGISFLFQVWRRTNP
ncbi:MAG: dfrA [Acidimicrobiaceae bacterium]|nr:dfrA [Acidimicrobiaceae bacterium]